MRDVTLILLVWQNAVGSLLEKWAFGTRTREGGNVWGTCDSWGRARREVEEENDYKMSRGNP